MNKLILVFLSILISVHCYAATTTITKDTAEGVKKTETSLSVKVVENKSWVSSIAAISGFFLISASALSQFLRNKTQSDANSIRLSIAVKQTKFQSSGQLQLFGYVIGGVLVFLGAVIYNLELVYTATI